MFQAHGNAGGAGGAIVGRHDPEADCICVMSYGDCIGHYCGLTLLSFRGWTSLTGPLGESDHGP